jgi:hypothetical protein
MYLGYMNGRGKINIDPTKMEAILKWLISTNVIELRDFLGKHNTYGSS